MTPRNATTALRAASWPPECSRFRSCHSRARTGHSRETVRSLLVVRTATAVAPAACADGRAPTAGNRGVSCTEVQRGVAGTVGGENGVPRVVMDRGRRYARRSELSILFRGTSHDFVGKSLSWACRHAIANEHTGPYVVQGRVIGTGVLTAIHPISENENGPAHRRGPARNIPYRRARVSTLTAPAAG